MSLLSDREIKLIKILTETNEYLPVKEIAERLNTSTKTIYRDIEKLSENRKDLVFEKKQGKGIKLSLGEFSLYDFNSQKAPKYSIEERRIKMLYAMLQHSNEYTSIENLSYKYYVGKSSIVNDLKYIEEFLLGEYLSIEKNRFGTKIQGEEKYIRKKIAELVERYSCISEDSEISEYYSERINGDTIKELSSRFPIENIEGVEHIINSYEDRLPHTIGDMYYINLVIHILITIDRIKSGNYVTYTEENKPSDENYYREARNIAIELEEKFDIVFPKNEIYYIYQYLVSAGVSKINYDNSIPVEPEIEELANEFLEKISNSNLFLLDSNRHTYYAFKLHLRALLKRLNYKISVSNPLTEKIKNDFRDIFDSVKILALKTLSEKLTDDEIAYLTIYVQSILEENIDYKNVVLVCHSGFGTSQFLKKRIETIFTGLNIVEVLSSKELREYDLSKIDYIISTVNLGTEYKSKLVNVNVLLLDSDIKRINKIIFGEK